MKNKFLILIPLIFFLVSCGDAHKSQRNESKMISNSKSSNSQQKETPLMIHEVKVSNADFISHVNCTASWTSSNKTDTSRTPTMIVYTSNLTAEVSFIKNGFVSYTGTAKLNLEFELEYTPKASGEKVTKKYIVSAPLDFSETKRTCTYKQTFQTESEKSDSAFIPQSQIPYGSGIKMKVVSASNVNITATYYNSGISGDTSLSYKSYFITLAYYSYYFSVGNISPGSSVKDHTTGTYVYPRNTSDLYDYDISMKIGDRKVKLRRDGYFFFDETLDSLSVRMVEGSIDVYPGKVL